MTKEEIKELAEFLKQDCLNKPVDYCENSDCEICRATAVVDAGWRRQIEAEWTLNCDGSGTCSNCHFTQRGVYDQDSYQRYCGCCGAKMKLKGA